MPRVFAALPVAAPVLGALGTQVATVRWPRGIRAVPSARWHVTAAFFGDVEQEQITDCLIPGLRATCADSPALRVRVVGSGGFRSGVLYLKVTEEGSPKIAGLAEALYLVGRGCQAAGSQGRPKPYRAHITVARRRQREVSIDEPLKQLAGVTSDAWDVTEVHLVESTLGPQPNYRVVATFPLSPRS